MERKIVLGAGKYFNNPGWIYTQEDELSLLNEADWERKFSKNSIDALLAEHVWEHLTLEEGNRAATICYQYLKPGGYIRCAVPDGYFRSRSYQQLIQVGGPGSIDHPAASHKVVYQYKSLTNIFNEVGFDVHLLEYCDEQGDFHWLDWDESAGIIFRSKKLDPRNKNMLVFPSLIIDAFKPS
ncbi:Predicted SAM-depedendent methyltransferase [Amphibacillus marinus]|uniref:Predicted SAM-depedendent methyltransferase n=1 Tax=Amphibacillus marinus TaxID=872970 RepID=A0A1H8SLD5_9BACI|nr:methyltransferase domain-containing protein [Amphibacillus marinus]SEO79013.1 Predicted SAM-depedendent methyltransferase [Amphibacillus marinus]